MRQASDAFNRAAMNGQTVGKVECYLADGTYVEFGPQDIMQGGISVTSATSNSGSFGIGCAVIGRCTIRLRNDHRQLNGMALSKARVIPYVGALVDDEVEWLKLGVYWVEPFEIFDDVVSLSCLDALSKLEVPCPTITGPITLGNLAKLLCQTCGLTLATEAFHNHGYTIQTMPDLTGKSCLEALSYVAQVAGCYVVADYNGHVRLSWYATTATFGESNLDGGGFHFEVDSADGGGFHFDVDDANGGAFHPPYAITELRSLSASVAPHTVTGLAVSDSEGTQHVEGVDGYVLHIRDNPLIEPGRADDVALIVAPNVVGASLRSVRVSMPGSPVMEAGDPITVIDRYGEEYDFWATSMSWSISGTLTASCDVESSSPLVRTVRRQTGSGSVDAAQVASIVNSVVPELPEITTLQTSVGTLQTDVGTISTTVGGLSTDLSGLSTDVSGLSTSVGGLQSGLNTATQNIGSDYNYASDGSINDRLNTLENSQWTIQVNGVTQTTGTINFITQSQSSGSGSGS